MTPQSSFEAAALAASREYRISLSELLGPCRKHPISHPRQLLMLALRESAGMSLAEIGWQLGGRDHTTVKHGIKSASERAASCAITRQKLIRIKQAAREVNGAPVYVPRHKINPPFKSRRVG